MYLGIENDTITIVRYIFLYSSILSGKAKPFSLGYSNSHLRGIPSRIRTYNPYLRRVLRYPIALLEHMSVFIFDFKNLVETWRPHNPIGTSANTSQQNLCFNGWRSLVLQLLILPLFYIVRVIFVKN